MEAQYRKGNHCVYSLQAHAYFVVKYRRRVLTSAMFERIREVSERVLAKNRSTLLAFGGEPDHVHLWLEVHPDNNYSQLCGSMKSATSRIIGKEFAGTVRPVVSKGLWGKQLYLRSVDGAPLSKLQDYISSHSYG